MRTAPPRTCGTLGGGDARAVRGPVRPRHALRHLGGSRGTRAAPRASAGAAARRRARCASTEYAGRGALAPELGGRDPGRRGTSTPASSKIASANSAHVQSPSRGHVVRAVRHARASSASAAREVADVGRASRAGRRRRAHLVLRAALLAASSVTKFVPGLAEEPGDARRSSRRRPPRSPCELRAPVDARAARSGRTRRTARPSSRRRRSRSRSRATGAPSATTLRVPCTFTAAAPAGRPRRRPRPSRRRRGAPASGVSAERRAARVMSNSARVRASASGKTSRERAAELAARARDQDARCVPLREDRDRGAPQVPSRGDRPTGRCARRGRPGRTRAVTW